MCTGYSTLVLTQKANKTEGFLIGSNTFIQVRKGEGSKDIRVTVTCARTTKILRNSLPDFKEAIDPELGEYINKTFGYKEGN